MTLNELQNIYPGQGKVENLLVRPKRTENAIILDKVTALKDVGRDRGAEHRRVHGLVLEQPVVGGLLRPGIVGEHVAVVASDLG